MKKTFFYSDEINDDFAGTDVKQKAVEGDHKYFRKNVLWNGCAWVLHHFIATPIVFLYLKVAHFQRVVGRSKLRKYLKNGFYLYGNHSMVAADAFTPSMVTFPRKPYIIVGPDAVSVPMLGNIVEMLG